MRMQGNWSGRRAFMGGEKPEGEYIHQDVLLGEHLASSSTSAVTGAATSSLTWLLLGALPPLRV